MEQEAVTQEEAMLDLGRSYHLACAMLRWDHLRRQLAQAKRAHRSTRIKRAELALFVRGMLEAGT